MRVYMDFNSNNRFIINELWWMWFLGDECRNFVILYIDPAWKNNCLNSSFAHLFLAPRPYLCAKFQGWV
jgi:hypothetical protein